MEFPHTGPALGLLSLCKGNMGSLARQMPLFQAASEASDGGCLEALETLRVPSSPPHSSAAWSPARKVPGSECRNSSKPEIQFSRPPQWI